MRAGNLIVVVMGVVAAVAALAVTISWWRVSTVPGPAMAPPTERRPAALDAVRTVAVMATTGVVAGLACAGLVGRLVMRVLAATSGASAQGSRTEAGEIVGRISRDGTVGFILFVGLSAGLLAAVGFLALRRLLPAQAGPTGLVLGLILLGTIGVADPLSPDNVDFRVLTPTWLAVLLVVATALLLGTTFATLAARLEAISFGEGRSRYLAWLGVPIVVIALPLLAVVAGYVGARSAWPGVMTRALQVPAVRRIGVALVVAGAGITAAITAAATVEILRT